MKWYVDNSDLCGIKDAKIPDIVLIGGIAVPAASDQVLKACIEKAKAAVGSARAPIKWNVEDLRRDYEERKAGDLYEKVLKAREQWRTEVFRCLAKSDAAIIISVIEGYSANKAVLVKTRDGLVRHAFSNGLMRFGLHAQETKAQAATVVMDWPEKDDPEPFNSEYAHAYCSGTTTDGNVKYSCGALADLGFADSTMFTKMRHSTLLQAADLVVGAARELVGCSLEKRGPGQGIECLKLVKDRFRGAPEKIIGRGISISSGNEELGERIAQGIKKHL